MNNVLDGIKPKKVFYYFEKLTQIPRGSGNEKEVSDYLVNFAKERNLKVKQDDSLNVVIEKDASEGYENAKTVILQGHLDIVCAKEKDVEFDFEKDPINIYIDGDMIRTKGTTLGADNGIAIAMAMAILDSDEIMHPKLIVLATTNEETGMEGVMGLEKGTIKGDILINIDSEEEGVLLASCAGGARSEISLPIKYEKNEFKYNYRIFIDGLLGGHSGIEIDKKRASAIKLMGRVLSEIDDEIEFGVSEINGGEKMNAIAKRCEVLLSFNDNIKFEEIINDISGDIKNELKTSDEFILIEYELVDEKKEIISTQNKKDLISLIRLIPQGIQTMSADIEGLVESSSNVGVIKTNENGIFLNSAIRSSINSLKFEIVNRIVRLTELTNSNHKLTAEYPEWQFKKESYIRNLMKEIYSKKFNGELKVDAIHAGLECGFLKEKLGDIDMVSIGPNMYDVHTPNEHVSISSVKNVYEFLMEVLKEMK
ncbi:aminoacyl-histidine dipeptidase [Clostridiaceae bacterium HSG29]|nr:aminoacyl-histidine dipeptidase [Clostridiaceae bacterium HSG29]